MIRYAADFPRPPAIEPVAEQVRIILGGAEIARTASAWRILETTHPPTYYLPAQAFVPGALRAGRGSSFCEWKGMAQYFDVLGGALCAANAGWGYARPNAPYAAIADHVAVYAGRMDACFVGDERVTPQEGGFYGGWITAAFGGPFKGAPGTAFW